MKLGVVAEMGVPLIRGFDGIQWTLMFGKEPWAKGWLNFEVLEYRLVALEREIV